jgi:hypothetical protein
MDYNLYKNFESRNIFQAYKGLYSKNEGNDIYLKVNTTEYFLTENLSAQINHDEKIIFITGTKKIKRDEFNVLMILDEFNPGFFREEKNYWEIELLGKPFSGLPYARIVIQIGKDFFIQKQVFYYSTGTDFSKDYTKPDIQFPRLEIICSQPQDALESAYRFDSSKYFTISDNNVKLSAQCIDYTLVDRR